MERLHLAATWKMNGWMGEQERGILGQEGLLEGGQGEKQAREARELPHLKIRWRRRKKRRGQRRIQEEILERWQESQERASQGAKGRGRFRKEGVGSQVTKRPRELGTEEFPSVAVLDVEAGDELVGTMRPETSGGRREACGGGGKWTQQG